MNTKIEKHINDLLSGRKELTDEQVKDIARKIYVQGQTDMKQGSPECEEIDMVGFANNLLGSQL